MERFEGVLEPARQGGAVVALPPEVLAALGRGRRFRARGTFGGSDYRSSTMPTGDGGACLGVHKATREAAGVAKKPETRARRVQKIVEGLHPDR